MASEIVGMAETEVGIWGCSESAHQEKDHAVPDTLDKENIYSGVLTRSKKRKVDTCLKNNGVGDLDKHTRSSPRKALSSLSKNAIKNANYPKNNGKVLDNPTERKMTVHEWFGAVRSAFSKSCEPSQTTVLKARNAEFDKICEFVFSESVHSQLVGGGFLYISGQPGTGKSTMVSLLLEKTKQEDISSLLINCMCYNDSQKLLDVMSDNWLDLGKPHRESSILFRSAKTLEMLEELFVVKETAYGFGTQRKRYLLVLDELDRLVSSEKSRCNEINVLLNKLFEWCEAKGSRLVLIGISNCMDLLTSIKNNSNAKSSTFLSYHISPYTSEQILLILKGRVSQSLCNGGGLAQSGENYDLKLEHNGIQYMLFNPLVLELCSRKTAAVGDLRKALDLAKFTVECAEGDFDNCLKPGDADKEAHAPKYLVEIKHIQKAISYAFSSTISQEIDELNMQHQIILAVIGLAESHLMDLGDIHTKYVSVCKNNVYTNPLSMSEFREALTLLEGKGLIHLNTAQKDAGSPIPSPLCSRDKNTKKGRERAPVTLI